MTDQAARTEVVPGGFQPRFHWRILGTPAPVFPGFEIDICDRISDEYQPDAVWHRERAKGILRDHPEVKQLFVRSPATALWCLAVAGGQIAVGILLAVTGQPWWIVLLVAYTIGAIANIALFNLAHECNHSLVFKHKAANRWLFTATSLPMMFSLHHSWWIEHHMHHNHLGSPKDFIKRRRSTLLALKDRIFGWYPPPGVRRLTTWITTPLFWPISAFMIVTQTGRAMVGLLIYAVTALIRRRWMPSDFTLSVLADQHLVSGYHRYKIESWAVLYPFLSVTMMAGLVVFFGWTSLLYMFLSALFATGFLHPLAFGLILSNSHFHGHQCYQPSASNYGWINWLTFNFGLHTEHHDFACIPWHQLPALTRLAPEYYDSLQKTRSFVWLALQFAFGSREQFNNEEYRNLELLRKQPQQPVDSSITPNRDVTCPDFRTDLGQRAPPTLHRHTSGKNELQSH